MFISSNSSFQKKLRAHKRLVRMAESAMQEVQATSGTQSAQWDQASLRYLNAVSRMNAFIQNFNK